MCDIVRQELTQGVINRVCERPQCVHALGGVEKSNGKLRPITDCSMPENRSINRFMSDTFKPFTYNSVTSVVKLLRSGNYMSVVDLQSAFRTVNVYAPHVEFQGFSWNLGQGDQWYVSNRLCFGLRCAPYIFSKLSDFIVKVAKKYGVKLLVNYLDDFIVQTQQRNACASVTY